MDEKPPPSSLFGVSADAAARLVHGVAANPTVLAMLVLNGVMVIGWISVLMVVARSRTEEMRAILQLLSGCLKGGS